MGFESINSNTGPKQNQQNSAESRSFKQNFSSFIKRSILFGAISIATTFVYQKFYSQTDYTSVGSFNKAFKKARENNEEVFKWNGERFTTDLVSKEFSKEYWESKKFLEDYYNSDYFKQKNIPTSEDSFTVKYAIQDRLRSDPRYQELGEKIDSKSEMTEDEWDEYMQYSDLLEDDSVMATEEFRDKIDSIQDSERKERIDNLEEPTSFSITNLKGKRTEDGSYIPKTKEVYIYKRKDNDTNETTAVHELTHKSSRGDHVLIYHGDKFDELKSKAYNSIKNDQNFIEKYGREGFDYLADPTEIDAKQNSARFWLFKHFPGYTAGTTFTEEHYDFLKKNYQKLPYDIQQEMDLFPVKEDFISNMNKY